MVVLIPKTDKSVWDTMFDHLDDFSDDFMQTRTNEPTQKREELF